MKCPQHASHRFKEYGTNKPTRECVRCGWVHADIARAERQQQSKPVKAKPQPLPRVACATCGDSHPVNTDGRMRAHWPSDSRLTEPQRMRCGNSLSWPHGRTQERGR